MLGDPAGMTVVHPDGSRLEFATDTGMPVAGDTASATVEDPNSSDGCPSDVFGLSGPVQSGPQSGSSTTALPAETYSVTVTDPGKGQTTVTLQVTTTAVVEGQNTYQDGTPVPVSAP